MAILFETFDTGTSLAKNELENWEIGFFTKTVFS